MKLLLTTALASSFALAASAGEPPAPAPAGPAGSFATFDARARAGERLTVVFFGGSLTWSANATEPNRTGFRGLVGCWLEARYPNAHFRFVDAAIGGTGSLLGIFRLDRDVLAFDPDLVFLDFSCNDGWDFENPEANLPALCAYESIARRLSERGVPVVHVFFTFQFWMKRILAGEAPEDVHGRLAPYRRIAEAYGGATGDVYRDSSLLADLRDGRTSLDEIWPIDGGHPDDLGYRYFAEAAERGFERAVTQGLVCRVPGTPVFGDVADVTRWSPGHAEGKSHAEGAELKSHAESAEGAELKSHAESAENAENEVEGAEFDLPPGWTRKRTYRTSLWYDGLPSRWMDDVAVFAGTNRAPLSVCTRGNFVGVFGEADETALFCDVRVDGAPLATWRGAHGSGKGRLFIWRSFVLPDWLATEPAEHEFAFDPVPDGTGEFHVGSICTATLLPVRGFEEKPSAPLSAAAPASGVDTIEAVDHARGKVE